METGSGWLLPDGVGWLPPKGPWLATWNVRMDCADCGLSRSAAQAPFLREAAGESCGLACCRSAMVSHWTPSSVLTLASLTLPRVVASLTSGDYSRTSVPFRVMFRCQTWSAPSLLRPRTSIRRGGLSAMRMARTRSSIVTVVGTSGTVAWGCSTVGMGLLGEQLRQEKTPAPPRWPQEVQAFNSFGSSAIRDIWEITGPWRSDPGLRRVWPDRRQCALMSTTCKRQTASFLAACLPLYFKYSIDSEKA